MWLRSSAFSSVDTLVKRADAEEDPKSTSSSASALVSTLVPSLVIAGAMILAFIILRRKFRRHYVPRTFVGNLLPHERTPESPTGLFDWIIAMYKLPDTYVLQHHSLDAYLLLRYLKLITIVCLVGCCITWPILFPINATGKGNKRQLDILAFSNVADPARYFAHAFVAWIFLGFVFYLVTREIIFYINLRQAYAFSPAYANRISSKTVLFTAVPDEYLDQAKLRRMFGEDKIANIWLPTDVSELEEKVKERDAAAMKLEAAEIKLIKNANAARLKELKKKKKKGGASDEEAAAGTEDPASAATRWLKPEDRPTHRLKFLIGKKVDTIEWARAEIERLNPEIEELQAKHRAGQAKRISAVFIEFVNQNEAQAAYQMVSHNLPLHMSPRYIGVDPTQVIWSNLRIMWWERVVRNFATIAFVVALIIFWAIPVAVVGAISNIDNLTDKVTFLRFILDIPDVILGVVTGLLPSVLLAVLMALLPIIIRLCAQLGGAPTAAAVELWTQNAYFGFQVVQVFLVTTLSSAATSVVTKIVQNPTSAADLLAHNLPRASNFYVSYIVLQGLTFTSGALLNIGGLIIGKVLGKLLDTSPRKLYRRWSSLSGLGWGTVLPPMSLLAVIAITYSCIAPLVMGFATIGLYLFYFAFRYNLLYVSNASIDTKGEIYPRALQHLLVGCYLSIVCLIGLFAIGTARSRISLGPMILMIIFLVFAVLYHVSMNEALTPLIKYLPKNLETEDVDLSPSPSKGAEPVTATSSNEKAQHAEDGTDGAGADVEKAGNPDPAPAPVSSMSPRANLLLKFLRPDKYASYATLRRLVPNHLETPTYPPEVEQNAYFHPAITSKTPLLWIPRDEAGISKLEVEQTSKVTPITDEDAWLDEKNNLRWNEEKGRPPIYEEKIYY